MARHTITRSLSRLLHVTFGRKYSWGHKQGRRGHHDISHHVAVGDKVVEALLQGYDWWEPLSEGKPRLSVIINPSAVANKRLKARFGRT